MQPPHSFNSRHSETRSHRRCASEPLSPHIQVHPLISNQPRPRYSFLPTLSRKPPPTTEIYSPHLSPRVPTQHYPPTRIGQPALKLAAIKERLADLEATNERFQQRINSYETDIEMLNSSVSYFSSEYYSGLLTIRDLRARTKRDAEVLSSQEYQLCQLKKFVGLMVEIGLHEPVLARVHSDVIKGTKDFETTLVESIRSAAARPGSAWSHILASMVAAENIPVNDSQPTSTTTTFDDACSNASTVDDLLQSLKNGDIPSTKHRSIFSQTSKAKSPPQPKVNLKSPKTPKPPFSIRPALASLDPNRVSKSSSSIQSRVPTTKKSATARRVESQRRPKKTNGAPADISASSNGALASLQRIIDHFSSGSLGSLEMSTEGTSQCEDVNGGASLSPIRICIRPPTSCSGRERATRSVATLSPTKVTTLDSPLFIGSPPQRRPRLRTTTASPSLGSQSLVLPPAGPCVSLAGPTTSLLSLLQSPSPSDEMLFTLLPVSLLASTLPIWAVATPLDEREPVEKRAVDFNNPTLTGGSWLDASAGLGEPLNVVISAQSSPEVLTTDGFLKYANAIGFDKECLGLHIGNPQQANLGDGRGWVNETEVLREDFGVPGSIGTCLESLEGGNHFRVWQQAGTNAIFLAVSKEEDAEDSHNIIPDGYNIGRDLLVAAAVGKKTWFDISKFKIVHYTTVLTNLTGFLAPGSDGINHGIAQDGVTKLLTVTIS
ncbi:hypothetical protein MIND_00098200 [Mycena indigotica]|uniref:Uncharacterized protein n=1 Tax=Mycena indigotica TaxID=2126181 RepID=A0A8H6TFN8_9AGAR|nr:uncharacterized protein MIND_00098200 [Mycena indigotica]KAF7315821.1 hypothetical protein MIND_00098200 [Mycena indigotica]